MFRGLIWATSTIYCFSPSCAGDESDASGQRPPAATEAESEFESGWNAAAFPSIYIRGPADAAASRRSSF